MEGRIVIQWRRAAISTSVHHWRRGTTRTT